MEFDIQKAFDIAEEAIKIYSSIKTLHTSDVVSSEKEGLLNSSLSDYLEIGKTDELKKILIVAKKIYNKQNSIEQNPIELTSTIDDSIEIIKTAIKVAEGKIDTNIAAQKIVDRVAVRAISAAEIAIENGVPVLVDNLCNALVVAFPEMAPAVPIIKIVAERLTPKIKEIATKGIKALAKLSKPYVAKGLKAFQNKTQKISSKVKSWALA